ncbi:MAG: glycosyltransferase [Candidatus Nezhaarchaeales archaeon]
MPELLLHFSIIFAVSAPLIGIKRGLLVSFIALLPDIDALFQIHRSMSHSVVILSIVALIIILTSYKIRKGLRFAIASGLALLSHPLLDVFQDQAPLFYPISSYSYHISLELFVIISKDVSLKPSISVINEPFEFTSFQVLDAPIFTSQGFIISLILIGVPLIHVLLSHMHAPASIHVASMMNSSNPGFKSDGIPTSSEAVEVRGKAISRDDVTILIPTLNEEKAIGRVIQELIENGYKKILVVDGYSSDRTVEVARENGAEVIYQVGHGKVAAIKTGLEKVDTPYVLIMDGDGTYNPEDIEKLLKAAEHGYDEVIGFRVNRKNIPKLHRIGNKIISTVISLLMGQRVKDPCSGMYLLRTDFAKSLEITATGFDIEAEIVCQSLAHGKVAEVPISYRERVGRSKLRTWSTGFRILLTAFKIAWLYNPIILFSSLGTILGLAGLIILTWQLYLRYVFGESAWSVGWTWFGLVLLILGVQAFTITIISLMLKRMERRMIQLFRERRV